MLADIIKTYYRFVPGRQMNRTCWFVQRKTLLGWLKVGVAWSHETASDQAELLNGVPVVPGNQPYIERSAGGPLLHMNTGYKHFLSLGERIQWVFGRTDAYRLQKKCKNRMANQPRSDADKI